jgi:hypothetical protein
MHPSKIVCAAALLACCTLSAASLTPKAPKGAGDSKSSSGLKSLDLEALKIQWFANGEEELPAWLNAHFDVEALGQISGEVTETDLSADGVDEDGDPAGFDTSVFSTADGSLRDVSVSRSRFAFTLVYTGSDPGRVTYLGSLDGSVPGGWRVTAVSRSPKGDSAGRNRFPLDSEEKETGKLEIFTKVDDPPAAGTQAL